jgi:hypothetical protein
LLFYFLPSLHWELFCGFFRSPTLLLFCSSWQQPENQKQRPLLSIVQEEAEEFTMFSFWGSTPAAEEKKKPVLVVHPMDFTAAAKTPPSHVNAVRQPHLAGSPMTSDDSFVKLTEARDYDPLQIERGFSSPCPPEPPDDEGTAPATSTEYGDAPYNLDNVVSDQSLNEVGERYANQESTSFGEETAAAVLEELERQDFLERQANIQPIDFAGDEEEIDLILVEQYDNAFNEFIFRNPRFLVSNPDLVHNLRVTKLQKLLEKQDQIEEDLAKQFEAAKTSKLQMEMHYQIQLKDAARLKAARDIHWQAHLHDMQQSTRTMEAQLTWDLLTASEQRAKQEFAMARAGLDGLGYGRHALATLIPGGPEFDGIRDAIMAPPNLSNQVHLNEEQEKDLRQFQMDNAFLNAELAVLQKKMGYQQIAKKKHAWVESVLVRMEEKTMRKLKAKYQKKTGVQV